MTQASSFACGNSVVVDGPIYARTDTGVLYIGIPRQVAPLSLELLADTILPVMRWIVSSNPYQAVL